MIDWLAYGHALKTEKDTGRFGEGDIRGVIASESSNNAKEGGALVPTLAFGVPGSASMAILLGAFQGSRQWGDLYVLLGFGAFGWIMKRQGWPRPPLILGVVLGDIVERYLFISVGRYEWAWMTRPLVVLLFALAVFGLLRPLLRNLRATVGKASGPHFRLRFSQSAFFTLLIAAVIAVSIASASQWNFEARIIPLAVGYTALACALLSVLNEVFLRQATAAGEPGGLADAAAGESAGLARTAPAPDGEPALDIRTYLTRAAGFFAWCGGYAVLAKLIGMLAAIFVFVAFCVRFWGRETMARGLLLALGMTTFCWLLFDRLLAVPWPQYLLGDVVRSIVG